MERQSFLGREVAEKITYQWHLPGIGEKKIGFGLCQQTGLVLQTTCVSPGEMLNYYEDTATYVQQDNAGKPPAKKIADVKRQISFLQHSMGYLPNSALQVGSSDGYTLSRFREAGFKEVIGVEPGRRARDFALKYYNVDSIAGSAEDFDHTRRYDVIILTHILEHIYDPLQVLKKLALNLTLRGHLLIEVPLWERIDLLRPGVLTFEHVNYFCESTLSYLLYKAGFEVIDIGKHYHVNHYPVITIVARPSKGMQPPILTNYKVNQNLLSQYIDNEILFWEEKKRAILNKANPHTKSYIYGGGIHTSQLLYQTQIDKQITIEAVIDSSSSKWGKKHGCYSIVPPDILNGLDNKTNIIISSAASENHIYKFVKKANSGLNIIPLYEKD